MCTYMERFSRKQAGVIYAAMKREDVVISKDDVAYMYDLTEGGIDWNGTSNKAITNFCLAVDAIFENDYEAAQRFINRACRIPENQAA